MGVKFFGQFLLERKVISAEQLLEATRLQREQNRTLGEIAVERRYLSRGDANMINREQRITDKRFGDLASELKLMTDGQIEEVVQLQWKGRLRIGEALVKLGHMGEDRLDAELQAFQHDQSPYDTDSVQLPDGAVEPEFLETCVDLTHKLLLRVGGLSSKLAPVEEMSGEFDAGLCTVAIEFSDALSAWYGLSVSDDVAQAIAKKILGDQFDITPEVAVDALCEFANIVCGNVCAKVSQGGRALEIGPPDPGWKPNADAGGIVAVMILPEGRCELRIQQ